MANERKGNSIIIGVLLVVVLLMSIGFAASSTRLTINSKATVGGKWDVRIINLERVDGTEGAAEDETEAEVGFTSTTATFNLTMAQPGDYAEYEITVKNQGSIDATLKDMQETLIENGTSAIKYTVTPADGSTKGSDLLAGAEHKFNVRVEYDADAIGDNAPAVNAQNGLTLVLDYEQK